MRKFGAVAAFAGLSLFVASGAFAKEAPDSPQAISETKALNVLEANGYSNIGDLQPMGDQFQAQAMKDGKTMSVMVDPSKDTIEQK